MQKNITVLVIGLLIGAIIGFNVANRVNRNALTTSGTGPASPPFQGQSVDNVAVKDQSKQGAMMPEVEAALKLAAEQPGNFDAQMAAGNMFLKIRNFEKALQYLEAANKIKPGEPELIVTLGNTYFDSGDFETAEGWYMRALQNNPNDINVRTDLGITFVERDKPDLDRAIKEFRTSLETDPNHEPTLYNLAYAYYKKGDGAGARETMARLEKANPKSDLLPRLKQLLQ